MSAIPTSPLDPNGAIYHLLRHQLDIELLAAECVSENVPQALHDALHSQGCLISACLALGWEPTMAGVFSTIEKDWRSRNEYFAKAFSNQCEHVVEINLRGIIISFISFVHAQIIQFSIANNYQLN